jgi:CRP-like cAMP-binding protein
MDHRQIAAQTGLTEPEERLLRDVPLFRGVAPEQLRLILSDSQVRDYARRSVLFLQDDPALYFYVVIDGWVKLYRESQEGQETVIALFTSGESFAEAASFADGRYPVCAEVVETSRLLKIPAKPFKSRLEELPSVAINMLGSMSLHLRVLVQQVEQRSVQSTTQRLSLFLLRLCQASGGTTIQLPSEKGLIAARLGMRPETFSRALAKLRSHGIEVDERQVTIPDVRLLQKLAQAGS